MDGGAGEKVSAGLERRLSSFEGVAILPNRLLDCVPAEKSCASVLCEVPNGFFAGVPAGVLESAAAMVFAVDEVPKSAFDGRAVVVSAAAFENIFERGVRGVVDVPRFPPNIEVVGLAFGVDGLGVDGGFDPNPVNGALPV